MEYNKEEFIKSKKQNYYINKYKKKMIAKKSINKILNEDFDEFNKIYSSATVRIRNSLKKYNIKFNFSYDEILGCTKDEFKSYIGNNLLEDMNFNNFGEWEMDHTVPISSFKFETMDEIKTCFNYKNIKPMWKEENRKKRNKI
jgi:hypothetical protein